MRQVEAMQRSAMAPAVPPGVRVFGGFVLEVLPGALASLIGGVLLVHCLFSGPATAPATAGAASGPASPEMVARVRNEHALLRQVLAAAQTAPQRQVAAAADDAQAQTAAAAGEAAARPASPRHRTAATAPLAVGAAPGPAAGVIARAQQIPGPAPAGAAPAAGPVRDEPTLIADTRAVKDQVVGAAVHAVKLIGGIPFWIGRRLGANDANAHAAAAAS